MYTRANLSPAEADRIFQLMGYFREGLALAEAIKEGHEVGYRKSNRFHNLNGATRNSIEELAQKLLVEDIGFDVKRGMPFSPDWSREDVVAFFNAQAEKRKEELQRIFLDEEMLEEFEKRKRMANRLKSISAPLLATGTMAFRASHQTTLPPIDWFFLSLSILSSFAGAVTEYQAARNDPDVVRQKKLKKEALWNIFVTVGFSAALIISLVGGGPLLTAAIFTLSIIPVCIQNMRSLKDSVGKLIHEVKNHKEPKESYGWRVAKRVSTCIHKASNSSFYVFALAVSVVIIVGVLAANPIGGALLGGLLVFAAVSIGISVAAGLFNKIAKNRIKKIEKKLQMEEESRFDLRKDLGLEHDKPGMKRSLDREFREASRMRKEPVATREGGQNTLSKGLQLMRKMHSEQHSVVVRSSGAFSGLHYEQLHHYSVREIVKKKTNNIPLYRDISYNPHFSKEEDKHALLVEVPRSVQRSASSHTFFDRIERHRNAKEEVEITLSSDPSDNAIFLLLDVNRAFAPLIMEHCGDPMSVLKVFEAAKLGGIEVSLDPVDRQQLLKNEDPKLTAYFKAIEGLSSEQFKSYVEERIALGASRLGQVPEKVPEYLNRLNRDRHLDV